MLSSPTNPTVRVRRRIRGAPQTRVYCSKWSLLMAGLLIFILWRILIAIRYAHSDRFDSEIVLGDLQESQDLIGSRMMSKEDEEFFSKLEKLPPPPLKKGAKFFNSVTASKLVKAEQMRRFVLYGFQYCNMLNGAIFDGLVHVHVLGGSVGAVNPKKEDLVKAMEEAAEKATKFIQTKFEDVNPVEAKRYACFAVAEGSNPTANLTDSRFIVRADPVNYFKDVLPAVQLSSTSITPKVKKKYKIAYIIPLYDKNVILQLEQLLDILDDGHAIFLLHVDSAAEDLVPKVDELIVSHQRTRPTGKESNVYAAKFRNRNIWGHISVVFTHLSGFLELMEIAEWDYVINISPHDWPLRTNTEIHRVLELHPGRSWIDYWSDTDAVAKRILRPHMGKKDYSSIYHPPELSVTGFPFSHWKAYKQMQWMILSRNAVEFLLTDPVALNYLAFMEHAFLPEESFFATVLYNSEKQRRFLINDKRRYVRTPGDPNSPDWIGYNDRHIFPPGQEDPEFFFFRPFNALGDQFGEALLKEWVQTNHLELHKKAHCHKEQLGFRDECIHILVGEIAIKNEIIVIPTNKAFFPIAQNLRCSLRHLGLTNVLFWALDIESHEKIVAAGDLSYFIPSLKGTANRVRYQDEALTTMMRQKPTVLRAMIGAGFHVWMLDADTVVLKDFRAHARSYVKEPIFADVILGIDGRHIPAPAIHVNQPPNINCGIMYLRNTERAKEFLDDVIQRVKLDRSLDDQDAVRQVVGSTRRVTWTGIGSPTQDKNAYPAASTAEEKDDEEESSRGRDGIAKLLGLDPGSRYRPSSLRDDGRIRVHFFDPLEFVNGHVYFRNRELIPVAYKNHYIVHANGEHDVQAAMKPKGLWFLDDSGVCDITARMQAAGPLHPAHPVHVGQADQQRQLKDVKPL